jgi:site-specific DNA recombinase
MKIRAVTYARVSSKVQKDKHTIESQLRVLPEFVARNEEWTLVRSPKHYVDDGLTAKAGHLDDREALNRLLRDALAHEFDVVVVVDFDRLTRAEDIIERASIYGTFQRAGVKLANASTGEVLDLSSGHGDLMANFHGYFAAEENRKRRTRTVEGKLTAIGRGRKPSGPTPFGLTYDRTTGQWGIDDDDGPIVAEIYKRLRKMESCNRIAVILDERGASRPRGGRWNRERVWKIATNPAYRGVWIADKARNLTIPVPAIVTEEVWYAAQDALSRRRSYPMPKARYFSVGEGISFCELCGEKMLITGNKNKRRYYVCRSKKLGKKDSGPRCPNRMHFVPDIDERIWSAVKRVLERPDLLAEAVEVRRGRDHDRHTDWNAELVDYERKLARLEKAEGVILNSFRRGKLSEAAFNRDLEQTSKERALLELNRDLAQQQLAIASRSKAEMEALTATANTLRERLEEATAKERRDLVRLLVPGRDGYQVSIGRDRVEIAGLLRADEPVFRTTEAG